MPGGKFEDAVNALVAQFGLKKRSTFTRWSHMTQTLAEAIRHKLDAHAELPQELAPWPITFIISTLHFTLTSIQDSLHGLPSNKPIILHI